MKFLIKNKLVIIIVFLSIGFLSLIGFTVYKERATITEDGVGVLINPIQKFIYKVNVKGKNVVNFALNFDKVKKENEELVKENNDLKNKISDYENFKKENNRLREMLNYKEGEGSSYNYVGCDIVGVIANGYLDGFTLDKGTNAKIKKGMVAITSQGLVGKVTEIGSNWSKIQVLSNENIAVAGSVQRTSQNNGIVKGFKDDNNNVLARIEIPDLNADIKEGDVILTSGIGGIYPKGIKIGKVIRVEVDKVQYTKYGIIQPYVSTDKLEEVFIVVSNGTRNVPY